MKKEMSEKRKAHDGLDKGRMALFIIFSFILLTSSFFFDNLAFKVFSFMNSGIMDVAMLFLSNIYVIAFFFILASFFLHRRPHDLILLWLSIGLTFASAFIIKIIVQRQRPFDQEFFALGFPDYSFPSMHTAFMFSTVYLLSKNFPKESRFFIIYASFVGVSRIYLHAHHLSDVLSGAFMGFLIGYLVYVKFKKKLAVFGIFKGKK